MSETSESIIRSLRANKYAPVYFLQGEEDYFIDQVSEFIEENALEEAQKGFNQMIMYGRDANMDKVLSQARRFPMMSDRQVVIVKEAQEMSDWNREGPTEALTQYLNNIVDTTILVFCYKHKQLDKRKKLWKAIDKNAVHMTAKKIYDNKLPEWIGKYVRSKNVGIDQESCHVLAENIGNDLSRLTNEIEKVLVNIGQGQDKSINSELIQEYIGISKEYNIFEFQKAIGIKDVVKANRIVAYFASNPKEHSLIAIISVLYAYFSKLLLIHHSADKSEKGLSQLLGVHPFILKEYRFASNNYSIKKIVYIIKYLKEADLKVKGVDSPVQPEGEILKELLFKILH
ncbi:DNA polymerase III subunit delta [Aureibacter tunicatorum]|uniref:DNA polymerase III subunit delta n=1 Tax=Aureibacter tunicatorum TaxID=866807 RepID=A0AAE3XN15_9BACT|nr:DNA polymerase III subunit delta [Aureibacter tunicatorum]MDR6239598.1 DNA polymerase-3 subunit delta [Aureibacter tunicatorum]BDD04075.1 DNA polymerase III subunit delta [Aureibacter tunicatorum]